MGRSRGLIRRILCEWVGGREGRGGDFFFKGESAVVIN